MVISDGLGRIYIVKMSIVKCCIFVNFSSENKFCSVLFCSII